MRYHFPFLLCATMSFSHAGESLDYPGSPLKEDWITGSAASALYPDMKEGNTVYVCGGVIAGHVAGGMSMDFTNPVRNNRVDISGDPVVGRSVFGGYGMYTSVTDNKVHVSGGTFGEELPSEPKEQVALAGGYSAFGEVSGNTVVLEGGTFSRNVAGGFSTTGAVSGNCVDIHGGTMEQDVWGGCSSQGHGRDNVVRLFDGSIKVDMLGCYILDMSDDDVCRNRVEVHGGSVEGNLFGAYLLWGQGDIIGNSVLVTGGNVAGSVVGGIFQLAGDVLENKVVVTGGNIGENGMGIFGGRTEAGRAERNTVIVSGGRLIGERDVDGEALSGFIIGGYSASGVARENTVVIAGGRIDGDIIGGYSEDMDAVGNTVVLSGSPDIASCLIFGGMSDREGTDVVSGNTLRLEGFCGKVGNISNFASVVFSPASDMDTGRPMMDIGNGQQTDLRGTRLVISMKELSGGVPEVAPGDSLVFMKNDAGFLVDDQTVFSGDTSVYRGISRIYTFEPGFSNDGKQVQLTLQAVTSNPALPSLSSGRRASLALLNRGAGLLAEQGMTRTRQAEASSLRWESVVAFSGGYSRYHSAGGFRLSDETVLAGVVRRCLDSRSLLLGVFAEGGWGNYTSHVASVNSSGRTRYAGGALLARYDFGDEKTGDGWAADASLRMGSSQADYGSYELSGPTGGYHSYDSSSPYLGGHVGVSYVRHWGARTGVVNYVRCLWLRQKSDSISVRQDHVSFGHAESLAFQGGARFHYRLASHVTPYGGLWYEWECMGKGKDRVNGETYKTLALRGGVAGMEAGVELRPWLQVPCSFDIGARGYTGKRNGISGCVQCRVEF